MLNLNSECEPQNCKVTNTEVNERIFMTYSFDTCPFCDKYVGWWTDDITKRWPLRPAKLFPVSYECPDCGTIVMISQVSDDREEVIIRFRRLGSALEQFVKFVASVSSLDDVYSEGTKAIIYGLLGAYTKDAIDKLYREARKGSYSKEQFEKDIEIVLKRYDMEFCGYCGRPVKRTDSFCTNCGRSIR